ncbi:MAG: Gfo/Idh/MocA family protein [Pirellulales bacterium]
MAKEADNAEGRLEAASAGREKLSVAIVGYGSIGRRHCENLKRMGVGRRVVVRRRDAVNPAFKPAADTLVVHSVQESIQAGIDLAIVCNPTSMHVATAREYLAAGMPVLIEKPLSAGVAEAERLVEQAERNGIPAGMAYCLRYHPAYELAFQYASQGELGEVRHVRAWFESYLPDWHPWEDFRRSYAARADLGGGVLPTLDHEIDFVAWCFGPPKSVSGFASRSGELDADIDDTATVGMEYGSYVAEIELSMVQRTRRRGFEFIGSNGRLVFSWEQNGLRSVSCDGAAAETLWHQPDFDANQMYLAMLDDALSALTAGRPLPVPLRAGLQTLRVAAALRS